MAGTPPEPVETCSFCFPECRAPTQESAGAPPTPGSERTGRRARQGQSTAGQPCVRAANGGIEVVYTPAQEGGLATDTDTQLSIKYVKLTPLSSNVGPAL